METMLRVVRSSRIRLQLPVASPRRPILLVLRPQQHVAGETNYEIERIAIITILRKANAKSGNLAFENHQMASSRVERPRARKRRKPRYRYDLLLLPVNRQKARIRAMILHKYWGDETGDWEKGLIPSKKRPVKLNATKKRNRRPDEGRVEETQVLEIVVKVK
jgi:hypothetical protein